MDRQTLKTKPTQIGCVARTSLCWRTKMLGNKTLASVRAANLNRRKVTTLTQWLKELNVWKWPKVFGGVVEDNRIEIMNEIVYELGLRMIKTLIEKRKSKP